MATGYFLTVGDKTTCGGRIITGCENHSFYGRATARNGDKYICGEDGKIYHIAGGIPNYIIHGVSAAGTLHSRGRCGCKCRFIPSNWNDSYNFESESKLQSARPAPKPVASAKPEVQPKTVAQPAPAPAPVAPSEPRIPVDAGYCILPYGGSAPAFDRYIFDNPPAGTRELYRSLNTNVSRKAGSIFLLVDPDKQDSKQIEHMKAAQEKLDKALAPLTDQQARFLYKNKDTVEMFAAAASTANNVYSYSGQATEAAKRYFERVEKILKEIETTYKNQYLTSGTLIGEQFYVERGRLFKELDSVLKMFMKHRFMFNQYADLKSALGLSTHSITHRWDETGVGDIEGYATHIEKLAKYIKLMDVAGKIGVGLSALDTASKITEACAVGRDCAKTAFTSIGEFSGSMFGGMVASQLIDKGAATAVCSLVLGAATVEAGGAGALLCTIGVAGGIGYGSDKFFGSTFGSVGEYLGKMLGLYEITSDE